ncbi:MAG: hypothetical protein IJO63_01505 [Bacilli bacterium]|nr:hypothetical protein [Bacilli bacterium]
MNKKGFIFIETIITVVVVMATLLLLYSAFSKVIINEQNRLYHDDISYIYKTKHIADVLKLSIDTVKFDKAVDANDKYVFIFNILTDIYSDSSLIMDASELYKFSQLVYIRNEDIVPLKKCLNNNPEDAGMCDRTKTHINDYGYSQLTYYLTTLDVPDSGHSHDGILVALFYEAKNGDALVDSNNVVSVGRGKYSECIYKKVDEHYNGVAGLSDINKKFEKYDANDKVNFDMACQNAYYISWVYL